MADFTQIQAAANAEATAHPVSLLGPVPPLGGSLASLNIELTIARVLEQLDSGTSWLRNRENHGVQNAIRGSALRANFDDAKNARATAKLVAGNLTNQLTAFNTRLSVNPLPAGEITNVTNDLNGFVGVNTRYIRNDASMLLTVANLRHIIATKIIHLPGTPPPVINLTQGNPPAPVAAGMPITTRPVAISGQKSHATNTIELRDRAGNILASDGNTTGANFDFPDIRNLANGWQDLVIRTTNPTTNVIHDTPYRQLINLPVPPVQPEGLNNAVTATSTTRGVIAGRMITPTHTPTLTDGNGHPLPAGSYNLINGGGGRFSIELPLTANPGVHKFRLNISNGNIAEDISEVITLTVTPPVAPTVAPATITTPAQLTNTTIPFGEHHAHIHLHHPVPGSEVTISGQGLPTPVTINIPNDLTQLPATIFDPAHPDYLTIALPGFDTHNPGIKQMEIVTTDSHNPTNTLKTKFTILVDEDQHHVPDNRRISEAAFMNAIQTGYYTLPHDYMPSPPAAPHTLTRYYISRQLHNGIRLRARVPVLPGDEKWFGRQTYVHAYTRKGLYAEVRKHLEQCNARAHAMNHSDHAHEAPHDPAHPETPATTPGATPSSAEAHTDAAHPAGAHPASEGTFYDRSVEKVFGHGWIGKGLTGLKNFFPKKLREIAGGATVSAKNGALAGIGVWLTGAGMAGLGIGGAALVTGLAPTAAVATFGYYAYQRMRYGRKGKEESGAKASEASH